MPRRALITGVTGQDGSYLGELLLDKGYEVHGLVRRLSAENHDRLAGIRDRITLHCGDLLDQRSLIEAMRRCEPDEIYNLAAMSYVAASWDQPVLTAQFTGIGVVHMLEAMRETCPDARFYQASSSEMFGKVRETPQSELTPFHPRSPYGVSKVFGHNITVNYHESYGLFACSGILFNHESPRRGLEFVTRKVSHGVASIKLGLTDQLVLGNLDARRDWGYAPDYVEAMWLMLQQEEPESFVIGTGVDHSVQDLVEIAFDEVGLDPADHVHQDPALIRPAEVDTLIADPAKAKARLGWEPRTDFEQMIRLMVRADYERLSAAAPAVHGEMSSAARADRPGMTSVAVAERD